MLERQLSQHGEAVTVHPVASGVIGTGFPAMAFVRGLRPDELVGSLKQGDRSVVLSPRPVETQLGDVWDDRGVWIDGMLFLDRALMAGDVVKVAGKSFRIEGAPDVVRMGSTAVRINLVVRG